MSRPTLIQARAAGVVFLALAGSACAASPKLAKMNAYLPIETERGFQQDGRDLDRADMADKLASEPASAPQAKRAQTLATISMILASVGGALVGWPLGELAAGGDPVWPLAYAGGGAIAIAIPLTFWSASSLNDAVESHNRALGEFPESKAPMGAPAEPFPERTAPRAVTNASDDSLQP